MSTASCMVFSMHGAPGNYSQGSSRRSEIQFIYIFYFGEAFEIPKDFSRKVLCVRVWGGQPNLLFFRRKVGKRTSPRLHHFILAKLLKFQETFFKKFLVSGFGADSPN